MQRENDVKAGEVWVHINGIPDYIISTEGRIASSKKRNQKQTEEVYPNWYLLKPYVNRKHGYVEVQLCVGSKVIRKRLNRLMLEVFKPSDDSTLHAAHLDGVKTNNRLDNLAWKTAIENNQDKKKHGTYQIGDRSTNKKLSEGDIPIIHGLREAGFTHKKIAALFNVSRHCISRALNKRTWFYGEDATNQR